MKQSELQQLIREEISKVLNENKLRETYFPAHSTDSQDLKNAKAALANWFKNIKSGKVSPQSALQSRQLDVLNDLINDYAEAYASDAMNDEDYM